MKVYSIEKYYIYLNLEEDFYKIDLKKFKIIQNKYEVDTFIENDTFITLKDLKFNPNNIIVVSNLEIFNKIKENILNSKIIGLDCEFMASYIPYINPKINLLQI